MSKKCPNCNYPNPNDRETCFKCGTDLNQKNIQDQTENVPPEPEVAHEPLWNMIGIDGNTYGPYTEAQLLSFISENRIFPETILIDEAGNEIPANTVLNFNPNTQEEQTTPHVNNNNVNTSGNTSPSVDMNIDSYNVHNPPQALRGWSWGGFSLTLIWGIVHSAWLSLLWLIGPISLIVSIYFGVFGNSWAWKSGRFKTPQECMECQKVWNIWGLVIFIINVILIVILLFISLSAGVGILGSERERARKATCLSNAKNVGTALLLYMDDWDDCLPPMINERANSQLEGLIGDTQNLVTDSQPGSYYTWLDYIYPYIKQSNTYVCPSVGVKMLSYAFNPYVSGFNYKNIMYPSDTVAFGEALINPKTKTTVISLGAYMCTDQEFDKPWLSPSKRHDGKHILGYVDGHVKVETPGSGPTEGIGVDDWGANSAYWNPRAYRQ
ncbi:MAG: DUF1559 domain-containing protein [Abditibacteriota bacterium]|nr:DUF1559 domain-containing protein [Abditibacteriota bacterium]